MQFSLGWLTILFAEWREKSSLTFIKWTSPSTYHDKLVSCQSPSIEALGKSSYIDDCESNLNFSPYLLSSCDCRGINFILSALVFNVAPTIFEVALVSGILVSTIYFQRCILISHLLSFPLFFSCTNVAVNSLQSRWAASPLMLHLLSL